MVMNPDIKILIVDDMPSVRKILTRVLKQLGFNNLIEADDGKSAWSILETHQVDLIIADWLMPKMNGLELLIKIRSSKSHKSLPFLMLTGEATKEQIIEAIKAGASNYIVKPFTAEIIQNKIKKVLGC